MLGYFPKPYPDELLASLVARYHCHTGAVSNERTQLELYGRPKARTSVTVPTHLAYLHQNIARFVGMTLDQLIEDTTLFPYYFGFTSEEIRQNAIRAMKEPPQITRALIPPRIQPKVSRLKACPECVADDIIQYGEPYWHRVHQVNIVHCCPKHAVLLLQAESGYFERPDKPLEHLSRKTKLFKYLPHLSERSRQRLTELARYAECYLNADARFQDSAAFSHQGLADAKAMFSSGPELRTAQIADELKAYFGDQCLEVLELADSDFVQWIRGIFFGKVFNPAKWLVFELFFDDYLAQRQLREDPVDKVMSRLAGQPWMCRNPAAEHFGQKLPQRIVKATTYAQTGLVRVICACGYSYTTKLLYWSENSEPKLHKVSTFGPIFVQKVRELRKNGMPLKHIAELLHTKSETVVRMLSPSYETILMGKRPPRRPSRKP